MHEPPAHLADDDVLAALRAGWDLDVDRVTHLAVGFGAYHWRAELRRAPVAFVTWDRLGGRHDAASLETAYASAGQLAFRLDAVVAGLLSRTLTYTRRLADGLLSVTPWVHGERPEPDRLTAEETARLLARLHAVPAPAGVGTWRPLVGAGLAEELRERSAAPWDAGPYGEEARRVLHGRLDVVTGWVAEYHRLARAAQERSWVVTHGEPHHRNQLRTPQRTLLVDWESVLLAPAERDLRALVADGHDDLARAAGADPAMLRLFDLEWRLDEIDQYAVWFAGEHGDGADEQVALGGLRAALGPSAT